MLHSSELRYEVLSRDARDAAADNNYGIKYNFREKGTIVSDSEFHLSSLLVYFL